MYRIKEKFIIKSVNDGVLLIDKTENKNIFQFNAFGAFIIINIGSNKENIIEELNQKFLVDKEQLSKDYDEFVSSLLESDIIGVV